MCGIAGFFSKTGTSELDEKIVRAMCAQIIHRGPDEDGFYTDRRAALGMRRLSIIDLAGGTQPIHNEDRTVWVVFNGEIYNFQELRQDLERQGHRFYTSSDTEILVHLYENEGTKFVRRLRGMFAFALYDKRKNGLLLARDRFGKKPLYYADLPDRLLFASEIKSMFAAAPDLADVDPNGILNYFYYGYVPDPLSAYNQIKKLPGGHLLWWENQRAVVEKYWDLPQYGTRELATEEEYLEELEHKLAESVRIRLISDVPLGALLSGGVDSSTVVGLMARASSKPVKTFSIAFRHEDFNEGNSARKVAERFGTEHTELVVEPDILSLTESLARSLEEPFADSSMIPTYLVSCLARKSVTVALSGDGGDELFAGYDRYRIHMSRRFFEWIPAWAGRLYRDHIYGWLPSGVRGRKFAYNATLPLRDRFIDSLSFLPAGNREHQLFSDEFLEWVSECPSPHTAFQETFDNAPATDDLSRLLYLDTKTYLTGDILVKVDRMSMLTSLEVRVPILDHEFAELAAAVPARLKLHANGSKYLLKKLAERVGVPRDVLYRRKQGFSLPLVHWMRAELKDHISSVLLDDSTQRMHYFRRSALQSLLNEHFSGLRDRSGEIWLLLMFRLWHKNFVEQATDTGVAEQVHVFSAGGGVTQS